MGGGLRAAPLPGGDMARKKDLETELEECREKCATLKSKYHDEKAKAERLADQCVRAEKKLYEAFEGNISFDAALEVVRAKLAAQIEAETDAGRKWSLVMVKKALAGL